MPSRADLHGKIKQLDSQGSFLNFDADEKGTFGIQAHVSPWSSNLDDIIRLVGSTDETALYQLSNCVSDCRSCCA